MRKVSIPDQVLAELGDELAKQTGAKVVYQSRAVMYIKGGDNELPFDVLQKTKDKFGDLLKDYSILWMTGTAHEIAPEAEEDLTEKPKCVIVLNGPSILTIWLTRRFGGATGGSSLWLVYDHPYVQSHYGYKGEEIPHSGEIISFIEQLYDNR